MVRHIVLWKLTDTLDAQEKAAVIQNIQKGLEGLLGTIPGAEHLKTQRWTSKSPLRGLPRWSKPESSMLNSSMAVG